MRRTDYKINIDKLEVCYTASSVTAASLQETKYYEGEGYRISSIDDEEEEAYISKLKIEIREGENWVSFGVIRIGSTFEKEEDLTRYVWIRIENKVFYTPLYPDCSILSYLYSIADDLHLQYNNITKLDVAIDSNTNFFSKIKKAVRNTELVPIILGKAYPEQTEIIEKILYIHTADRIRYRTNTLVISSKEKDFSLCAYNKSEEIKEEEGRKEYIEEWDNIKPNIYRLEIRLKRKALNDYISKYKLSPEALYMNLISDEALFDIFRFFSDKLIRFRAGSMILSVLEV